MEKKVDTPRLTSLCYIEKDGRYLLLHRTKKENDENHDKWIGVGDKIFLKALDERHDFFSLKLRYRGEELVEARFGQ
jgi:hypothetical protein